MLPLGRLGPFLLTCVGGLRYILLQVSFIHHLPAVSHADTHVLLKAIHHLQYTGSGQLWDARQWSQQLGKNLPHWTAPTTILPKDHEGIAQDLQVDFSAAQSSLLLYTSLTTTTVTIEELHESQVGKKEFQRTEARRQQLLLTTSKMIPCPFCFRTKHSDRLPKSRSKRVRKQRTLPSTRLRRPHPTLLSPPRFLKHLK